VRERHRADPGWLSDDDDARIDEGDKVLLEVPQPSDFGTRRAHSELDGLARAHPPRGIRRRTTGNPDLAGNDGSARGAPREPRKRSDDAIQRSAVELGGHGPRGVGHAAFLRNPSDCCNFPAVSEASSSRPVARMLTHRLPGSDDYAARLP